MNSKITSHPTSPEKNEKMRKKGMIKEDSKVHHIL
jgi:hypothetical protein